MEVPRGTLVPCATFRLSEHLWVLVAGCAMVVLQFCRRDFAGKFGLSSFQLWLGVASSVTLNFIMFISMVDLFS